MTSTPNNSESTSAEKSTGEDRPATLAGSQIVSAMRTAGARVGAWVRASALYRWLTAEPDPEVIVIDLRETWTVGPFLRVFDWVLDRLVDAAAESRLIAIMQRCAAATYAAPIRVAGTLVATLGLAIAGTTLLSDGVTTRLAIGLGLTVAGLFAMQDDHDWETLRETRPVTLALAALAPPEPPATVADERETEQSQDTLSEHCEESPEDDRDSSGALSEPPSDAVENSDSKEK